MRMKWDSKYDKSLLRRGIYKVLDILSEKHKTEVLLWKEYLKKKSDSIRMKELEKKFLHLECRLLVGPDGGVTPEGIKVPAMEEL